MALALLGSIIIGISLGLLGSGGSILAVPLLVFVLQRPEKLAIAESLAIVGCAASVGSLAYALRNQIQWRSVFFFGVPGMFGACAGGCGTYYISASLQMAFFAITMLLVSSAMLIGPSFILNLIPPKPSAFIVIIEGFLVGVITGLIGIGGGFLIVPALVILFHLPVSLAVGTSLVIIAVNSFAGFIFQLIGLKELNSHVDWKTIGIVAAGAILGSLSASLFAKKFSQSFLRKAFGWSVLGLGLYMLLFLATK